MRLSLIKVAVLMLLFTPSAFAGQDAAPDFYCDPGEETGLSLAFGGKPISLVSGAETFSRTDLTLGSLYPINVQRRYNSRSSYDSPLGYGWAFNYDKRIYTYPDGSVTLRKECGWKVRFNWSISGYIPASGEAGSLVENADGSFLYTDKNGEKETYDPQGRLTSIVDAKGNALALTYTSPTREALWGLLLGNINQTLPLIVTYDYRLGKIEEKNPDGQATGNWVEFHYDINTGRLSDIQDSLGRTVSYGHDSIGNLTSVNGHSLSAIYEYNDPRDKHLLTTIDDGKGPYINQYDSSGRVFKQTHGLGVLDFEYIKPFEKTKLTNTIKDNAGNVLNTQTRTVEFDSNGQVGKATDTYGNVRIFIRDSNMWLLREEYWENIISGTTTTLVLKSATDYTHDSYGNTKTRTEASNPGSSDWDAIKRTTWYYYVYELDQSATPAAYHKVAHEIVKSVIDPTQDRYTKYIYDNATGNLRFLIEMGFLGDGSEYTYTTTYDYYSNGKLKSIDGPRTDVQDITTYFYDPITNHLTAMTQPLIGTSTYSNHDSLGNPQIVTDPNGNSTIYSYDSTGRVKTVKASGDTSATEYFYVSSSCSSCGTGGANKIDYIVLPEGNRIDYDYDSFGSNTKISDNAGNSINYTYDSEGNKLTEDIRDSSGSLQKTLGYQYDALNRLKQIRNPDSTYTEYAYDSRGNRTSARNPNTAVTTYAYDALNRLTSTIQPGNVITSYGYNSNNNLTSVTDANGNTTTYRYDDKGRVYQAISPDTGTTRYSYDPAGNMVSKIDAKGVTVGYQYDALNRLTTIDFSTDTDIAYTYDNCANGKGRVCSMMDASGMTNYEYTAKGQVKKESKLIDSVTYVTQYSYNMNGNLKTMTYPSGKVITYNYSNDKAVSILKDSTAIALNISYKPFGGMSAITYGNGITGSINYDNQYRITGIQAGAVLNLGYAGYDNNGNITTIIDNVDPAKNKAFTYDALDRLSTAIASGIWGSLGWTHDGVGNRQTENGGSYSFAPNTNKLTSANGISFNYDNNGNTTGEASRQYVYNQNQRLIQVNDGITTANYSYNGNGQRVKKVVNGTTTIFHYNLSGQIIAESNSTGTITAEYVYLNGQPLAKIEGTNTYYYHNDHLGTPQKMTGPNQAQDIVWAADYRPFGEVNITTNDLTNNLRFPGQYYDAETGLHYNYYRDYNPVIGRYIQADPIGLRGGVNLYLYAIANSIKYTDRRGLEPGGGPDAAFRNPPVPEFRNPPPPPPPPPVPPCYEFNKEKYAQCLAKNSYDPTLFNDVGMCLTGHKEACGPAAAVLYMNLFGCYTESFDKVPRTKCGKCPNEL